MPFKAKLKKAFTSTPSTPHDTSAQPQSLYRPSTPQTIAETNPARWPSNVYRPDEPLPRLKYRAPVKVEHKKTLDSFHFGSNVRRASHASDHSPRSSRHLVPRRGSDVLLSPHSGAKIRKSSVGRRPSHSLRIRTSISAASLVGVSPTPSPRTLDFACTKTNGLASLMDSLHTVQIDPPVSPLSPFSDESGYDLVCYDRGSDASTFSSTSTIGTMTPPPSSPARDANGILIGDGKAQAAGFKLHHPGSTIHRYSGQTLKVPAHKEFIAA